MGLVWGGGKLSIPLLFPFCLTEQNWRCESKCRAPPTFICMIYVFRIYSAAARGIDSFRSRQPAYHLFKSAFQPSPRRTHPVVCLRYLDTVYTPVDRRTLFTLCAMVGCPSPQHNVGHPYHFPPSSNSMTSSAGPGQP